GATRTPRSAPAIVSDATVTSDALIAIVPPWSTTLAASPLADRSDTPGCASTRPPETSYVPSASTTAAPGVATAARSAATSGTEIGLAGGGNGAHRAAGGAASVGASALLAFGT